MNGSVSPASEATCTLFLFLIHLEAAAEVRLRRIARNASEHFSIGFLKKLSAVSSLRGVLADPSVSCVNVQSSERRSRPTTGTYRQARSERTARFLVFLVETNPDMKWRVFHVGLHNVIASRGCNQSVTWPANWFISEPPF